jgi:hypothetical protein
MADVENIEEKPEETGAPAVENELSEADFEKVSGAGVSNTLAQGSAHCHNLP